MAGFWAGVDWVVEKMKTIGAACLVGMTLLTCVDVVGRFFRHPIFGSVELVGFMATIAVAMALPYTHKIDGHVGVEIAVRLLSERAQAVIAVCTRILSLALFVLITWRMAVYAHTIQVSGEVSMNLEFPEYAIIYLLAFCLLVFSLVILMDLLNHIRKLKSS
jgi:TRAP-type C4-dicarboxylate transport system permease small subunit